MHAQSTTRINAAHWIGQVCSRGGLLQQALYTDIRQKHSEVVGGETISYSDLEMASVYCLHGRYQTEWNATLSIGSRPTESRLPPSVTSEIPHPTMRELLVRELPRYHARRLQC